MRDVDHEESPQFKGREEPEAGKIGPTNTNLETMSQTLGAMKNTSQNR